MSRKQYEEIFCDHCGKKIEPVEVLQFQFGWRSCNTGTDYKWNDFCGLACIVDYLVDCMGGPLILKRSKEKRINDK